MDKIWLWWSPASPVAVDELGVLNDAERQHLGRLTAARAHTIQARSYVMRREVLGSLLRMPASAVELVRRCPVCGASDHGPPSAPQLAGSGLASLSVSHTEAIVGIAVATTAVGLDIELPRPPTEWREIADDVSHPGDRVPDMLHCWTAKEAVLKLLGVGLNRPMNTVRVTHGRWALADGPTTGGTVSWLPLPGGAIAAVAAPRPASVEVARWRGSYA